MYNLLMMPCFSLCDLMFFINLPNIVKYKNHYTYKILITPYSSNYTLFFKYFKI